MTPLWLWGDCGVVHCQETKGTEAEMNQCRYEIFDDTSLERDGTNRKMGESACPVESFKGSKYMARIVIISFHPIAGIIYLGMFSY